MPFDCTPVIDPPKQCSVIGGNGVEIRILCLAAPTKSSPIPNWYLRREAVDTATAVLTRARDYLRRATLVQRNPGARLVRRACSCSIAFRAPLLCDGRHRACRKGARVSYRERLQRA